MEAHSDIVYGKSDLMQPCIIYKDYNEIWAQLSHMYWSTSSNCLVSRHPLSCVDEIISHYCPHCLTRYMEDEANLYKSRCHSCFQCPLCESVLTLSAKTNITIDSSSTSTSSSSATADNSAGKLELVCRYCNWKSHIQGDDKTDFDVAVIERERMNVGLDLYKEVNEMHQKHLPKIDSSLEHENASVIKGLDPMPNRVGLRTKRVVRCKRDLELNKPNILVQQKPLPLEGDSSMKVYRGKWWVKDNSAIHFVPSLLLTRLPSAQDLLMGTEFPTSASAGRGMACQWPGCRLELCLSNPRDVAMTVSIQVLPTPTNQSHDKYAPFHCLTVPLTASGCTADEPVVTASLAAYEDELLREAAEDEDDELVIFKAFESQLEEKKRESKAIEDAWLAASLHNTVRVSIPLQRLDLEQYKGSIFQNGLTGTNKLICTLSLRLSIAIESGKSSTETSSVDHLIALPFEW